MTLRFPARFTAAALTLTAGAALLTGCAAAVPLQPAANAIDAGCAAVVVHLPAAVADETKRETNAQGTGAWGDPASILLHCGVAVPGPTTQACVSVNGIDWIEDDSAAPTYRFTTYGREPAVEVVLDSGTVAGSTVLADLSNAVSYAPTNGSACVGAEDLQLPEATPAP
ncbi:DUF3515 family protein [Glaciibacter psychrotolerans]|uniref:DUF3515 domain-containing protein n=1 Tax=Glaciibacter psychrotolerans TaxID=670054 RepID=A0A7Z0J5T6_9MICO|nr:DUF3515 family protein [Leifsonia psychrotolerans]NYJ19476.1 hypothetical protein [Leifsonia psychrotolerans]